MKKIIAFIRHNGLLAILALFLSWMSWVLIGSGVTETKTMDIEVGIQAGADTRKGLIHIHGWRPRRVEVTITGSRRDMDKHDPTSLRALFRVRGEFLDRSGELQSRTFIADDMELPRGVKLVSMSPAKVVAEFAERGEAAVEVKVLTDTTRIPPDAGYELLRAIAIPAKIIVEGPSKLVKELKETGLHTERIPIQNHAPKGIETRVDAVFPLDLGELEKRGLRTKFTEVIVRLEFAHTLRKEVMVPLEVHWVDPDPAKPTIVKINTGSGPAGLELRPDGLFIPVTLRGPRVLLEGEALQKTLSKLRAYVRVDEESLKGVADGIPVLRVYFEGVPAGIVPEEIPLAKRPDVDAVPFEPR